MDSVFRLLSHDKRGYPVGSKLLLALRPYVYGEDVYMDDISGNLGEDVVALWRGRYGEDISAMCAYMIPESMQAEMFAIFGEGLWFDAEGTAKQVNIIELAQSPEINQLAVWYRLDAAAGLGYREVLFYHPDLITVADVTKIAAWFKEPGATSYPSAFFNGLDFRLATYTGGPTYVPDHLGVLRSPGSNRAAIQGMRLATTVADGAVLGPELITNVADREFTSDTGFWTKILATISDGLCNIYTTGAYSGIYKSAFLGIGKRYQYTISQTVRADKLSLEGSGGPSLPNTSGVFSGEFTATSSVLEVKRASGILCDVDILDFSIREVIPTYITTDSSGDPILPSTPQKTVTYSTDWLSKTFAETFDKFDVSDPLKAPGWLCEPVRTNKCTCRKSNPVDTTGITTPGGGTVSIVNSSSAIDLAGLNNVCTSGNVYRVTDSKLSDFVVALGAGNTNIHTCSAYVRVVSGVGGRVRLSGVGETLFTNSTFQRVSYTGTALTSSNIVIRNEANSVIEFILPQLEEGAFATSPICKASDGSDPLTSLTRSATIPSFPTAGKIPVNDFAIRMIVVPRASGQNYVFLFSTSVDLDKYIQIYMYSGNMVFRKKTTTGDSALILNSAHASGVPFELIIIQSSTYGMQIVKRSYSGSWGSFTTGTALTTAEAKSNAPIGATYQLGAFNGGFQFTGNISLFDCVPIPAGTTDPMAWAKTHWGVA